MPTALRLLVLLMALDYLSGVGVALLGKKPEERGRRAEQPGGVRRSGAQGDDFGDRPSGRRARSAHGERGLHRRGDDVLYRQRIAFDFENAVLLGVPVPQRLRQALDVARLAADSERKNQGRLNVAGVRRPPYPRPPRAGNFFQRKG